MSAPPLRRGGRRLGYWLSHHRWRSDGRGGGVRRKDADHQSASKESQQEHSHCQPHAAVSPRRRTGHGSRIPLFTLAGIRLVVNPCSGDGSRRVGPAFGIFSHMEAAPADGIPHAGLGQVQPERPEFQTLAKSPRHIPAILAPPEPHAGELAAPICGEPCREPPEAGAAPPARILHQRRDSPPAAPAPRLAPMPPARDCIP
jgi:hypothetical protein